MNEDFDLDDVLETIEMLKEQLVFIEGKLLAQKDVETGNSVPIPQTKEQAEIMVRMGQYYLDQKKED